MALLGRAGSYQWTLFRLFDLVSSDFPGLPGPFLLHSALCSSRPPHVALPQLLGFGSLGRYFHIWKTVLGIYREENGHYDSLDSGHYHFRMFVSELDAIQTASGLIAFSGLYGKPLAGPFHGLVSIYGHPQLTTDLAYSPAGISAALVALPPAIFPRICIWPEKLGT